MVWREGAPGRRPSPRMLGRVGSLLMALGAMLPLGVDGRVPKGDSGRVGPNGEKWSPVVCLDSVGIEGSASESRFGRVGWRLTSLVAVPATPGFARSFSARFLSSFANAALTVFITILCRRLSIFLLQYSDNPPSTLGMWCHRKSM